MEASAFEKSVTGFAYSASGMATLLLTPLFVQWFLERITVYLSNDVPLSVAQWGAWLFIVLAVVLAFFFINMHLQLSVRLLLRASARRGGF